MDDVEGLDGTGVHPERNGSPLDLVMVGYWYGRNGPGILCRALARVGAPVVALTVIGGISPSIAVQLPRAAARHRSLPARGGPAPGSRA